MSRGSPSDSFSDLVTAEPADIDRAVALVASVRRAERDTAARPARCSRSAALTPGVDVGVGVDASRGVLSPDAVNTSAAAGVSEGSPDIMPPVTLTPVTAAASPVRTRLVRRARRGTRAALCLPGARCVGTYFADLGTNRGLT